MKKSKILSLVLSFAMLASLLTLPATAAGAADAAGESHWSDASMGRWASVGVFKGDQYGDFMPSKEMTRAEFAQVLVNLLGYTEKAENTFVDIDANEWYADAMLKLVAAGVIQGTGYNEVGAIASPNAPISREQAAVLLCRALSLKPSGKNELDTANVSEWAKDAMTALTERGMMKGDQYGNLMPEVIIDRGSVAQMIDNMVSEYVTADNATVTGEQSGIVIVAAANVTIKDAKLAETLVVAPKAADATLTVTGKTTAADVVVAAEGAKVTVGKNATVSSITLEASKTAANVSGKVGTVAVAEKADNAQVVANTGAKIDTVTTAADKTDIAGARNTIGTIVAEPTAANATVAATGAKLENNTKEQIGSVKPGQTGPAPASGSSGSVGGGAGGVTPNGDSDANTYAITVDASIVNGTVTVNKTAAAMGETVTVTAVAAEGYELDAITVTDADNGNVTVTDGTFVMPGKAVTVTASFKAVGTAAEVYAVTFDTPVHGAITVTVDGNAIASGDLVETGKTVTVTAQAAQGYALDAITVTDADDGSVDVTDGAFVMPGKAVTIAATFTADGDATVALNATVTGNVGGAVSFEVNGQPVTSLTLGEEETKTVTVKCTPADGYVLYKLEGIDTPFTLNSTTLYDNTGSIAVTADSTVNVTATFIQPIKSFEVAIVDTVDGEAAQYSDWHYNHGKPIASGLTDEGMAETAWFVLHIRYADELRTEACGANEAKKTEACESYKYVPQAMAVNRNQMTFTFNGKAITVQDKDSDQSSVSYPIAGGYMSWYVRQRLDTDLGVDFMSNGAASNGVAAAAAKVAGKYAAKFTYMGVEYSSEVTYAPKFDTLDPEDQYTVKYMSDGQEVSASSFTTYDGDELVALPALTKAGYTLDGWYYTPAGGGETKAEAATKVSDVAGATKEATLTAKWTAVEYTITYDLAGGSVAQANPATYTVATASFTLTNPTKAGYTFAGWTGTGLTAATETVTVAQGSTGDKSFTATWTAESYDVTYQLDGGAWAEDYTAPAAYTYGTALTLPVAEKVSKAGYTFAGWYLTSDSTDKTTVTEIAATETGDKDFTAKWTAESYDVTYDLDGGALAEGATNPATYTVETEDFTLANPTKAEHTFAGWTGTGLEEATATVTIAKGSTGDKSFTATWTADTEEPDPDPEEPKYELQETNYTVAVSDDSTALLVTGFADSTYIVAEAATADYGKEIFISILQEMAGPSTKINCAMSQTAGEMKDEDGKLTVNLPGNLNIGDGETKMVAILTAVAPDEGDTSGATCKMTGYQIVELAQNNGTITIAPASAD